MASCKVCGKWSGLFSNLHDECQPVFLAEEAQREQVKNQRTAFHSYISSVLDGSRTIGDGQDQTYEIDKLDGALRDDALQAFRAAVNGQISCWSIDLTPRIASLQQAMSIAEGNVDALTWERYVQLLVMNDIVEERLPDRCTVTGLPFNLQSDEQLIWCFRQAAYAKNEERTIRHPSKYAGLSVQVIPGVYARGGSGQTQIERVSGLVPKDSGILALTNRHLYFKGQNEALKLRLSDLISFTSYNDGVGVFKGIESAREQVFITGDDTGWFTYRVVRGMASGAQST